jgi:hypothetical protein
VLAAPAYDTEGQVILEEGRKKRMKYAPISDYYRKRSA